MNKRRILMLLVLLVGSVLLASCSAAGDEKTAESTAADGVTGTPQPGVGFPGGEQPLNQMMMGILSLEDTENAITAEQASTMLPYWKVVRSLTETGNVAQEELDGVTEQISEVLNEEQLTAIDGMTINPQDMRQIFANLGIEFGQGMAEGGGQFSQGEGGFTRPDGEGGPPEGGIMIQGGGEGGLPGGGFVFQGGGPGGEVTNLDPEQLATLQAQREESGGGRTGVNSMFLEAFITFLEGKVEG